MTKKKITILLAILGLCVIGQIIYFAKDYIWSGKNNLTADEESWNYEKYLEIGYNQNQIDKLIAEIERLNSIFKDQPDSYNTLLRIGNIYMMLEEYEKAESIFLEIKEAEPNYGPAHASLGELYASFLKDKLKAVEYYKKAIELTPWRPQYYRSLADLYWSDFPEKEKEIESLMLRGAEKYPESKDFYTYLASYFRQENNLSKAIHYLKAALKIEPDNKTLKQELAELENIYQPQKLSTVD